MITPIRKYLTLDREMKWLFFRSFFELGIARLNLDRMAFKDLFSGMDLQKEPNFDSSASPMQCRLAIRIGSAVQTAARFTPWKSSCLVQVLATQKLMRKQGVRGTLYLGTNRQRANSLSEGAFAHAWIKCGPHFVNGEAGHENYVTIACYSWGV